MSEYWGVAILGCHNIGVSQYRSVEILDCGDIGVGILGCWNFGLSEFLVCHNFKIS